MIFIQTWLTLGWIIPALLSVVVLFAALGLLHLAADIAHTAADRAVEVWHKARNYNEDIEDRRQDRALEQDKAEIALDQARFPTDANRYNLHIAGQSGQPFTIHNLEDHR